MMHYLTLPEVLVLHDRIITTSGGSPGIRDLAAFESALAQPRATFDGIELYPDIIAKAAALGFLLVANHPFVDGNKRVGHAAMEVFLVLNGCEIEATVDDQEQIILAVASGQLNGVSLEKWLREHTKMI
ncbi:MAG: type II toxin-antitoxin system death-on-curing family toxin [Candidatus Aminicenantes bacterium]|nr:type II toxin-antitoxin system death-on-curing family toxin [Candidatus Aminicenantes bacterium]